MFCFTGVITKAIYKSSEEDKKEEEVKKTLEQHDNIVTHYKNMIREQVSTNKLSSLIGSSSAGGKVASWHFEWMRDTQSKRLRFQMHLCVKLRDLLCARHCAGCYRSWIRWILLLVSG